MHYIHIYGYSWLLRSGNGIQKKEARDYSLFLNAAFGTVPVGVREGGESLVWR